jgi:hypothetical protein
MTHTGIQAQFEVAALLRPYGTVAATETAA